MNAAPLALPVSPACLVRSYAHGIVAEHGPRRISLGSLPAPVALDVYDLLGLDLEEDLPGEAELAALCAAELARVPS